MTQNLIVDAHLDLAYNAVVLGRDLRKPVAEIRAQEAGPRPPRHGTCLASLPALREGHVAIVGASLYVPPASGPGADPVNGYSTAEQAHAQAAAQLDVYRRWHDEDARVRIAQTASDLAEALASWETPEPHIALFVVMEGAEPITSPAALDWWVERGLRGVALAWSAGSRYAGGNAAPGPLTDAGRELLAAMAERNLLLDLSHLWEEAAYEALDRYPGPLAATHANPRAFVDSPRMLSDDLIRRIAEREGVVGILPYNRMLQSGWRTGDERLPLRRVVEAIDYVCQVTGEASFVGLGSDFDGGFGRESVPQGLDSSADLAQLAPVLREYGYGEGDVAAILRENWLRVLRRALMNPI